MNNLPIRRPEASLSRITQQTARAVDTVRHNAIVAAARAQATEAVTNEAITAALGIAMTEATCSRIAPHAAERFRVIAESGTQALACQVVRGGYC